MNSTRIYLLAFSLVPLGAAASELSAAILRPSVRLVQGEPLVIRYEAANVSGGPLVIARGPRGFEILLKLAREDGKPRPDCEGEYEPGGFPGFEKETLPANWREAREYASACFDEPGVLIAQVTIRSQGPYRERLENVKLGAPFKAWAGEVRSEPVRIEIVAPQGVDKQAYDEFYLHPTCKPWNECQEQLLAKYPASIYAGYALTAYQFVPAYDPRNLPWSVEHLIAANFFSRQPNIADCLDTRCTPPEPVEAIAHRRRGQFATFLRLHPEFAEREKMEWVLGLLYLTEHRYSDAEASFKWCAGRASRAGIRETCSGFLSAMREKGLIAASPASP